MNTKHKLDLYAECNTQGAPVDVFTAECCTRCVNPGCTRSSFGGSKFDLRVNTWYDRLFENVPRMDPSDPRYPTLAAQNFITLQPELNVSSGWVDPLKLAQPDPAPTPPPKAETPESEREPEEVQREPEEVQPEPEEVQPEPEEVQPEPEEVQPEGELAPPPKTEPRKVQRPPNLALTNTPAQKGKMIKTRDGQETPKKGSWDAPIPTADTEGVTVIAPGSKIKLGGSGVDKK